MVSVVAEEGEGFVDYIVRGMEKPSRTDNNPRKAVLECYMLLIGLVEIGNPTAGVNKEGSRHCFFPYRTSSTRCDERGSPDSPHPAAARNCWRTASRSLPAGGRPVSGETTTTT